MPRRRRPFAPLLLAVVLASAAAAQTTPCTPAWSPGFFQVPAQINAQAVFDDGTGPALYIGASSYGGVFKLTVSGWQPVGAAPLTPFSLVVFNDGTGSKLYAGGNSGVARWNGATWTPIGNFNNGGVASIAAVTVGGATSLFAGGNFTYEYTSGQQLYRVARWTGSTWAPLGPGLNGAVTAFAGFNDGSGVALYAAGNFGATNGGSVFFGGPIAKWNGAAWTSVGSSGYFQYGPCGLQVFNDGSGPALYLAGQGSSPPAGNLLRWNGSVWLGLGLTGSVNAMAAYDDGTGPALYVTGGFTTAGGIPAQNIARWTQAGWAPVGNGVLGNPNSLVVFNDGAGPALYAAGSDLRRWNGVSWLPIGVALGAVSALAAVDLGSGPQLVAGGDINAGPGAGNIARYANGLWQPLGSGIGGTIFALAQFDSGAGPQLYAAGNLSTISGSPAYGLARWNGFAWSSIGDVLFGLSWPPALGVFDDGTGPALYLGGAASVGGLAANYVAKWDGSAWTAIGSGLNGTVHAVAMYDDGTGSALYIGGEFTSASGAALNGIAKWSGNHWAPVGIGVGGQSPFVQALAVYESVGGPALYVGGTFTSAGGLPVPGIAKLTGSTWSSVGSADQPVYALTIFDAGDGPALYAGGNFTTIGGTAAYGVAKWNGSSWSALDGGVTYVSGGTIYGGNVRALAGICDQSGAAIWAGGYFNTAGSYQSVNIARYAASAPVLTAPQTWPVGTPLDFGIQAAIPNAPYVFDFSITGSAPGFNIGTSHVPMNQPLVNYTYGYLLPGLFQNFWGYLDPFGRATAQVNLPNDAALAGFTLSSSFATLDITGSMGISSVACGRSTTLIPAKPQIATVSPPTTPATGGQTLSIAGSGFQAGATVRIGAGYATNVVIGPALVTCTAPPGPVGPVALRVDNPNATGVARSGVFAYVTPIAVTAASPLAAANGTTITVDGTGFQPGATVTIGGSAAPVTSVTPAQIHCTWPAGVPCGTTLVVHDPDGQTASTPFNPSPSIGFVFGDTGPAAGGTSTFILGTNFLAGTTVTIGGAPAPIQSQSATSILVTVPPGSPGPASIVVSSASGCTATSTYHYN